MTPDRVKYLYNVITCSEKRPKTLWDYFVANAHNVITGVGSPTDSTWGPGIFIDAQKELDMGLCSTVVLDRNVKHISHHEWVADCTLDVCGTKPHARIFHQISRWLSRGATPIDTPRQSETANEFKKICLKTELLLCSCSKHRLQAWWQDAEVYHAQSYLLSTLSILLVFCAHKT